MITLYTKDQHSEALANVFSAKQAERFFREDEDNKYIIWRGVARDGSKKYVRVYAGGERVYVIDRPCDFKRSLLHIDYVESEIELETKKQARRYRWCRMANTVNKLIWDFLPSWAHTVVREVCGIRLVEIESSHTGRALEHQWWTTKRWLEEGGC